MYEQFYAKIAEVPFGKVVSYGQVAKATGMFRGARLVGWALRQLPPTSTVPWQRVINQKGQISIINPNLSKNVQKELLESEGITIIEQDGYFTVTGDCWYTF